MTLDIPLILHTALEDYALPWGGFHGVAHWARVLENGLRLAAETGARIEVVQLFAVLHDCRRINENWDPDHGPRAAEFARTIRDRLFELTDADFALLHRACAGHTHERHPPRRHDPDLLGRRPARPGPRRHHARPTLPLHGGGEAARDDLLGRRPREPRRRARSRVERLGDRR